MRVLSIATSSLLVGATLAALEDRFTYRDNTETRADGRKDYSPSDWDRISCSNIDDCLAFPDKWHTGRAWKVNGNYCRDCPAGTNRCGRHHQSPINLERNRGIEGHSKENECIDVHWMKYEDSTCLWEHLIDEEAATVERFALRVAQPIKINNANTDDYTLQCREIGVGRRYARIDYSKGFSQWWFLSHMDFKLPSEHTQEGKRYSAEVQLYHFYSVTAAEAGVANEMGTVSAFMEAFDDVAPDPYLDKVICLWRRHEESVRDRCNEDPAPDYPGCFPIRRENVNRHKQRRANAVRRRPRNSPHPEFKTIHDLLMYNDQLPPELNVTKPRLIMDEDDFGPAEEKDWDAFIQEHSDRMKARDELYSHHVKHNSTDKFYEEHRRLIQGDHIPWFNYWPMLSVRTEYYYRYSGTQTIPPCYATFLDGSRGNTNHWRVLKDPIRISTVQLKEMARLLRERIAPFDDPVEEVRCKSDTAGKLVGDDLIDVARPLQYFHNAHFKTFCECKDWKSKWPEDRAWCAEDDISERFYKEPYNWAHTGF